MKNCKTIEKETLSCSKTLEQESRAQQTWVLLLTAYWIGIVKSIGNLGKPLVLLMRLCFSTWKMQTMPLRVVMHTETCRWQVLTMLSIISIVLLWETYWLLCMGKSFCYKCFRQPALSVRVSQGHGNRLCFMTKRFPFKAKITTNVKTPCWLIKGEKEVLSNLSSSSDHISRKERRPGYWTQFSWNWETDWWDKKKKLPARILSDCYT